jgi:hypothetical protein
MATGNFDFKLLPMNTSEIATKQDINLLHEKMNQLLEEIARLRTTGKNSKLEIYLTSTEVMETYKISKSQLSDLRIEKKIPHSKPFGILIYPKSEIEKIILDNMKFPQSMDRRRS